MALSYVRKLAPSQEPNQTRPGASRCVNVASTSPRKNIHGRQAGISDSACRKISHCSGTFTKFGCGAYHHHMKPLILMTLGSVRRNIVIDTGAQMKWKCCQHIQGFRWILSRFRVRRVLESLLKMMKHMYSGSTLMVADATHG